MKTIISLAIAIFSVTTFAADLPVFPDCYRGTMTSKNGSADVFVTFSSVENKLVRVQSFTVGNYSHRYSGTLAGDNSVTFNSNDDYIPGGNATYNIDIKLTFNGKTATGTFKEYRFKDGHGGFGQSDEHTLAFSGTMKLRKCLVKVVDQ